MTAPQPLLWWQNAWRLALAAVLGLFVWSFTLATLQATGYRASAYEGLWTVLGDPAVGVAAFVLVLYRRRWPMTVAALTALLSSVSMLALGPATLALASLATRRRPQEVAIVGALTVAAAVVLEYVYPNSDPLPWWAISAAATIGVIVVVAIGYAVGADRQERQSLRDRAETNEREQQARVAAARAEERTRIAREMHDVLAHRISLVTMHAGALTYRDDLPREQQIAVARTIEDNAQLAMHDLRDVLGVLRSSERGDGAPQPPQPGIADLPALIAEAHTAGARVELSNILTTPLPTTTGRTVYRLVQESLTNARKHAPSCPVEVTIEGEPGEGVEVVVSNPLPLGPAEPSSGAGMGLLGLGERVDLLGGTLAHGSVGGRFVVRASLPWSA